MADSYIVQIHVYVAYTHGTFQSAPTDSRCPEQDGGSGLETKACGTVVVAHYCNIK